MMPADHQVLLESEKPAHGAWAMVAVLAGCYLVSSIDRYVINLLLHPIATSLDLSDVEISLLVGLAFTIFYCTAGLLLGGLVDRHNRRRIIMAGILVWTAATAASGLAWNYTSLLIARIVVGAGEAALAPAAYSLIADIFPRRKLSRPTTLYFLGGAIGPGVSFVLGALALGWAEGLDGAGRLGVLGDEPWRLVMLLAALPGLAAVAAVAVFVHDPRVAQSRAVERRTGESLWAELASKPLLYSGLIGGTSAVAVYINGVAAWWPTLALRTFDLPLAQGGLYFGIALGVSALCGIFASGFVGTALMRRFGDLGSGIALVSLSLIAAPVLIFAPLIRAPTGQLVALTLALAISFAVNGLAPVGFQLAAGPTMRGRISAFYVASTTIVGAGLGPVAVASLGRFDIGGSPFGLPGALCLIGIICSTIMIAAYLTYLKNVMRKAG